MYQSYRFVVTGRVQGVWFRQSAKNCADALGLHGWVCNRMDGAVEGAVQGEHAAQLAAFREWLGLGPSNAGVESVQWLETEETPNRGFEIRR
ncbi:MAG: acylphosphatase [Panacagrimonas sp.]